MFSLTSFSCCKEKSDANTLTQRICQTAASASKSDQFIIFFNYIRGVILSNDNRYLIHKLPSCLDLSSYFIKKNIFLNFYYQQYLNMITKVFVKYAFDKHNRQLFFEEASPNLMWHKFPYIQFRSSESRIIKPSDYHQEDYVKSVNHKFINLLSSVKERNELCQKSKFHNCYNFSAFLVGQNLEKLGKMLFFKKNAKATQKFFFVLTDKSKQKYFLINFEIFKTEVSIFEVAKQNCKQCNYLQQNHNNIQSTIEEKSFNQNPRNLAKLILSSSYKSKRKPFEEQIINIPKLSFKLKSKNRHMLSRLFNVYRRSLLCNKQFQR